MSLSFSKFFSPALLAALVAISSPMMAATVDEESSTKFTGDGFDWLMTEGMAILNSRANDPDALAFVAGLFRNDDPRAAAGLQGYLQRFPNDPAAFDLAGTDLLRQGKFEVAAISFRRAIEINPKAHWTRAKLGTALILDDKVQEGLAELEKVNEADPENPLALRYLAWDALNNGNLPQAIIYSERALSTFGLPVGQINQAHLDLARLYDQAGRHFDVLTLLGRAVRNKDLSIPAGVQLELFGAHFSAALTLQQMTDAKVSLGRLEGIVGADAPQIKLSRARIMLQEGNAQDAQDIIAELRAAHPQMASNLVPDLAVAEAANGNVESAAERIGSLADVRGPGADLPLIQMALTLLLDAEKSDAAYAFIDQRSTAAPARTDLIYLAAEARVSSRDLDEAQQLASTLTQSHPNFARGHYLLGTVLYQNGDKKGAEASLRRSLELEPKVPQTWMTLLGTVHGHDGYSHASASGHTDVETLLLDAIAANPDSPLLRNELGLLYLSDGNIESAIPAFDEALRLSPGYASSLTLGALARADAKTDLDTAEILVTLAKQLLPKNVVTQDVEGWVAFQRGNTNKARDLLNKALRGDPSDATTRFHHAMLSVQDNKTVQARDDLLLALTGDLYAHYSRTARDTLVEIDPSKAFTLPVHIIDGSDTGKGARVGSIVVIQTDDGIELQADMAGLPAGQNSAHIHERPTCAPKGDVIGGAAGAHFGHDHAGMMHMMPDGTMMAGATHEMAMKEMTDGKMAMNAEDGDKMDMNKDVKMDMSSDAMPSMKPRGDLAPFVFDAEGVSETVVSAPQLTLNEIRGRSLMIHLGLDNDGKSGKKIACAVIP